jgi:hypothetical protein
VRRSVWMAAAEWLALSIVLASGSRAPVGARRGV